MIKVFTYIKKNSLRVKNKNFRTLGNKPLWRHLINELSKFQIYIDTDSIELYEEIRQDSSLENINCYLREQKFIDIENDKKNKISPALQMIDNFINKFDIGDEEIICNVHVTSPFLRRETLVKAIKMIDQGYEFVHSVSVVQDFAWLCSNDETLINPINFNPSVVERTQDLKKIYISNGAFFIFKKKSFNKYKNRLGNLNYFYELDKIESIEIDTNSDFELAERVYNGSA